MPVTPLPRRSGSLRTQLVSPVAPVSREPFAELVTPPARGGETAAGPSPAPEGLGLAGRVGLAAALGNPTSLPNVVLDVLGTLSPLGPFAMSGLKGAMAAHNLQVAEAQFSSLSPRARAELGLPTAFDITQTLHTFDPLGQLQTPGFRAQRTGEQQAGPQAPDEGVPGPGPSSTPQGEPAPGEAAPGSSPGDSGPGDFRTGGTVPDVSVQAGGAEPITAHQGEFVVRAAPAQKYRRLLEAINQDDPKRIMRAVMGLKGRMAA